MAYNDISFMSIPLAGTEKVTFSFDPSRQVWIDKTTGVALKRVDTGDWIGQEYGSNDILHLHGVRLIATYDRGTKLWVRFDPNTKHPDNIKPADLLRDITSFRKRLCLLTNKKD